MSESTIPANKPDKSVNNPDKSVNKPDKSREKFVGGCHFCASTVKIIGGVCCILLFPASFLHRHCEPRAKQPLHARHDSIFPPLRAKPPLYTRHDSISPPPRAKQPLHARHDSISPNANAITANNCCFRSTVRSIDRHYPHASAMTRSLFCFH